MNNRTRSEYSIINIVTGFGGYFINTVVGYICRMVFVRCLSAEYLGINGLFSNILSMLSLAELGIGGAIGFALYKPLAEDNKEKNYNINAVLWESIQDHWNCCSDLRFSDDAIFGYNHNRTT